MLRVGLEIGDLLRPHRAGMARYAHCLLTALIRQSHRMDIRGWASWRRVPGLVGKPANVKVHIFGQRPHRNPPDIFHATASVFPRWKSRFEIATVHDLIAIHEDLKLPADELQRRTEYIRRADRIICVSHHTRRHLHALLDIPSDRTVAIPLAVESRFRPASADARARLQRKLGLPEEFFLFVGRDRSNKNLDRLVAAYTATGLRMPLYFAGRQSRGTQRRLRQLAHDGGCRGSMHWLGAVGDADLPILLSCASSLCMPSIFEGFGLPIIEAMACETPVVTSRGQATEEAAGGKAILVDPLSIESIADGLLRSLQMTPAQRIEARLYVTRRTWDEIAAETLQVYQRKVPFSSLPAPKPAEH